MFWRLRNHSMLVRYSISCAGIILFACSVISVVLLTSSMRELDKSVRQEAYTKAQVIANDMEKQLSAVSALASKIRVETVFKASYWGRNPYYELEVVSSLKQFINHVPSSDSYFFFLRDDRWGFRPQGKTTFAVYTGRILGVADPEDLYARINTIDTMTLFAPACIGEKWVIVAIPTGPITPKNASGESILCYSFQSSQLRDRFRMVAGDLPGTLTMEWDDHMVLGPEGASDGHASTGQTISALSSSGILRATLHINDDLINNNLYPFKRFTIIFIVIALFCSVLLALLLAYSVYMPIKELQTRHLASGMAPVRTRNEIAWIGDMIESLKSREQDVLARLNAQYILLKRQQLLLLLNGSVDEGEDDPTVRSVCGITLDGNWFGAMRLHFTEDIAAQVVQELSASIEELSDDEMRLICLPMEEDQSIGIVLSLKEAHFRETAQSLIRDLSDTLCFASELRVGALYHSVSDLPKSYSEATGEAKDDESEAPEDEMVTMFKTALKQSDRHTLEAFLEQFLDQKGQRADHSAQGSSIIDYINKSCLTDTFSLTQVANHFGVHANYISRTVRENTSYTYLEYVTRFRIKKAKELLIQTTMNVSDISNAVGYLKTSYFIKRFKEITDVTPAAYRLQKSP